MFSLVNRFGKTSACSTSRILYNIRHMGCICVEPKESLVTEQVKIFGYGFKPNVPITIKSTVVCISEKISFQSFGHFVTTNNGEFDLSSSASVGGSYEGVDSMGLFWSMSENVHSINRIQVNDATVPLSYNFLVFEGHVNIEDSLNLNPYCRTSFERYFLKKGVKRTSVKIGKFPGTLFTPSGNGPFPAIITLYGSNKRGNVIEDAAAVLTNHGFVTLALQYYGREGLPRMYSDEPIVIEQFEEVVDDLLTSRNCYSVGVYGISKGAEIGIAMASYLTKVKAVASINGHISSTGTTTIYGKKVVPNLGMTLEKAEFIADGLMNPFNIMNNPEDEPETMHPFEHSKADLLFVAGLDDYNWRSEETADIARKKMDVVGKTNYELFKCPGLGHLVDAPFMPICVSSRHPLVPKDMLLYYGGTNKKKHAMQQKLVWEKVISFFDKALKLSSKI